MAGRVVAVQDAALARYGQRLEDLTFNSKPLIDDLTRAAEQLEPRGDKIVEMIQKHIMEVRSEWKLPSLYLLDSIMKNLKGSYLEHVGQVIVPVFCHCFEKLTEPDPRKMLYKLRTTWPPYVNKHKLMTLDKHVRALDPKWPVFIVDSDPPTATIFINPVFMEEQDKTQTTGGSSIEQRRKAVLQQTKIQHQNLEQEKAVGLSGLKDKDCLPDGNTSEKHKVSQNLQHSSRARSTSPLPLTTSSTRSHKSASPSHSHQISKPASYGAPPAPKRVKFEDNSKDDEVIKEAHLRLDDIPPELLPVHQKKIRERIERQINAGNLTPEQRTTLVSQLNQLYELQKHKIDHNPSHQHLSPSPNNQPTSLPESKPSLNNQPIMNVENQSREFSAGATHPPHYAPRSHPRGQGPYRRFGPNHRPYRGRGHAQVDIHPTWPEPVQGKQAPALPVGVLLEKLREEGIISGGSKSEEPAPHPLKIPTLALTPATLKQRYNSVIALLHSGTPCSSCGLRFMNNSGELYKSHLNWHYRINRQEKEDHRTSRNWFIHPDDWFKYEELAEDNNLNEVKLNQTRDHRESPVTDLSAKVHAESKPEAAGSCSVEADDANEVCVVCNEPFEQFWEEEEECWHFRDAIRTNPGGKLCHTFCYKDSE